MNRCRALMLLMVLALAGCGGGGDGDETGQLPAEFDLSGDWRVADVYCFGDFSQRSLDVLEAELLDSEPDRIRQFGNELEIVSRDSGRQVIGTISGNQVRYGDELRVRSGCRPFMNAPRASTNTEKLDCSSCRHV